MALMSMDFLLRNVVPHHPGLLLMDTMFVLGINYMANRIFYLLIAYTYLACLMGQQQLVVNEHRLWRCLTTAPRSPAVVREFYLYRHEFHLFIEYIVKINEYPAGLMMTLLVVMNMPANIILINGMMLVKMNEMLLYISYLTITFQAVALLSAGLAIAGVSKKLHGSYHFFVPLLRHRPARPRRRHGPQYLWSVAKLYEIVHTDQIISINLGPVQKINHRILFELILGYLGLFFYVLDLIRSHLLFV